MARVVTERQIAEQQGVFSDWTYNGLDTCVTAEVFENLRDRLDDQTARIYAFERACQQPAFAMQLRGVAVDDVARREGVVELTKEAEQLQREVDDFVVQKRGKGFTWGKGLPPSTQQLAHFLYDDLHLPKQRNKKGAVSTDQECMVRLTAKVAEPATVAFLESVLKLRGLGKVRDVLTSGLSPDGRLRFSMNVGATETGRWSSSSNPFGEGTNLQNIPRKLRNMVIADPGKVLVNVDLEQAESRVVAYLAEDDGYIEAHESGHVHVAIARLFWPELGLPPDNGEAKKVLKNTPAAWSPQHDYYDMSKRGQHGLNYDRSGRGLATSLGSAVAYGEAMREKYFRRFPGIPAWHKQVAAQIKATGTLVTPFGRPRQFFGRTWDRATIREAIAFEPQSVVADLLNTALLRVWLELDPWKVELLQQGHDAILFQVAEGDDASIRRVLQLMRVPLTIKGRTMVIPAEAEVGHNWRDMETFR